MKGLILSFLALFIVSCASTNTPGIRMLEKEADYDGSYQVEDAANVANSPLFSPKRTEAQTADIYVHGHELPTGDFFMGGKIRVLVTKSRWEVSELPKPKVFKTKKRVTGKLKEKERRAKRRAIKSSPKPKTKNRSTLKPETQEKPKPSLIEAKFK